MMGPRLTPTDFDKILSRKELAEAESWLQQVREQRAEYPEWTDEQIDRCEHDLIIDCCEQGWGTNQMEYFQRAKRIIEDSLNMSRIVTRRHYLERASGVAYEQI